MQANSQSSSRVEAPSILSDNEGSLGDGSDLLYEPEHDSTDSSFEYNIDESRIYVARLVGFLWIETMSVYE